MNNLLDLINEKKYKKYDKTTNVNETATILDNGDIKLSTITTVTETYSPLSNTQNKIMNNKNIDSNHRVLIKSSGIILSKPPLLFTSKIKQVKNKPNKKPISGICICSDNSSNIKNDPSIINIDEYKSDKKKVII